MKDIYIDRGITQSRVAVMKAGVLLDLYIENIDCASINGNIYKGRIENIVLGLNAAFVNIGLKKNGILHFEKPDDSKLYKNGQEVLVQVIREGIGDKGPRVSQAISIPGKHIVLLPGDDYIGVSKKIDDFELRKSIKDTMYRVHETGYGVIVRTESKDVELQELSEDYILLKDQWKEIEKRIGYMKPPQLLFNSKNFFEFIIREYINKDIDNIYINRQTDIDNLRGMVGKIDKALEKKIVYDEYNFKMQDNIEKEIKRAKERKIALECGGYIIIDHTEAFTCIDVNSGNFSGEDSPETTILNLNLEAAREIGRAIKLRNISGIILIDFIDMKSDENKNLVINEFENLFIDDKSKLKVYGFTKLGILETARAKKGIRISEFVNNDLDDKQMNPYYCLKLIENKCLKSFKHYKKNNFEVYVSTLIYDEIFRMLPAFIYDMKVIYGIVLNISKDQGINDFIIRNDGNKVDNNIHI